GKTDVVLFNGKLFAGAVERYLPRRVIEDLVPQRRPKIAPVVYEIEEGARVPVIRPSLRRHAIGPGRTSDSARPAIILEGRFERGELATEVAIPEAFNIGGRLRTAERE